MRSDQFDSRKRIGSDERSKEIDFEGEEEIERERKPTAYRKGVERQGSIYLSSTLAGIPRSFTFNRRVNSSTCSFTKQRNIILDRIEGRSVVRYKGKSSVRARSSPLRQYLSAYWARRLYPSHRPSIGVSVFSSSLSFVHCSLLDRLNEPKRRQRSFVRLLPRKSN